MNYEFFMEKALAEARKALRVGEFPVGCVMVHEDRVVVTGRRRYSAGERHNEFDHAEMLALRKLVDLGAKIDREKVTLFSTLEPCLMCYSALIVNGIKRMVYAFEDVFGGGTKVDVKNLGHFYKDMKIEVVPHILRRESLALFKAFFSDPHNDYLKGSILAEQALNQ